MAKPKAFDTWTAEKQEEWRGKAKQRAAKYCAENAEKEKQRIAKYYAENPKKLKQRNAKYYAEIKQNQAAIQFFQMTQAVSEIANINTHQKAI